MVNLCQFFFVAVDTKDAHAKLLGAGTRGTGGALVGNLAFTLEQAKGFKGRDEACVLVLRESTLPGQEEILEVSVAFFYNILSAHATIFLMVVGVLIG